MNMIEMDVVLRGSTTAVSRRRILRSKNATTAPRSATHAIDTAERTDPVALRTKPIKRLQGLTEWQARKALSFIEDNLQKPLRICDVACVVDRSVSYFSVGFRRTFGLAPYAYILGRRIERAKASLSSTDLPLCDIALDCGLSDQAHFSRVFKQFVGTSPGSWRRWQRDGRARS